MSIDNLFEQRFQSYFDDLIGRTPLWLFVHVPKTAGSSFNGELRPILSPADHIFVDYGKLPVRPFDEMLDEAVEAFIERAQKRRYRYCTGHLMARHVARISHELPDVCPITLLRDPVTRFVSDYRYQCSVMHPGHEQFAARHPTIESYIDQSGECNKAAAHLVPYSLRHDPQSCIDLIRSSFSFVGIQEEYDLSLRLVTTLAGAPRRPKVFKRVNTPTPETEVTLSADQTARIRANNALDISIYDYFAARFRAAAPGLQAYLDRVDPLAVDA